MKQTKESLSCNPSKVIYNESTFHIRASFIKEALPIFFFIISNVSSET